MAENIKCGLMNLLRFCLTQIVEASIFVYEIIRNPIKNVSIWLIGILSLMIYENIEIALKGKEMIMMTVGLVSILTYISNFLEKQTLDIDNKKNFYLGHNIKKLKFHDNFWLKRFNELSVRLVLWVVALAPIVVICAEKNYRNEILNEIFENVAVEMKYIESIWLSVFIVVSFYSAALLIESVALSTESYSQNKLYKTINNSEKHVIKIKIKQYFRDLFKKVFGLKSILGSNNDFYDKAEKAITYIINRGNEVSLTDSEKIEFHSRAFQCEEKEIDELFNKVYKYAQCDPNKKISHAIAVFLFNKIMNLLKFYYDVKWSSLIKLEVLPLEIITFAIPDLNILLKIDKVFYQNAEYKRIFWGIYRSEDYYSHEDMTKSNLCISKILAILKDKFRDINFLNQCNDMTMMMNLFDVLNRIDSQTKDDRCFPPIFKILFRHIIDDRSKENAFVESFLTRMKNKRLPEYLISESNNVSKEILMSGDSITNDTLKYLLNFMHLEDIIVTLIFRLAYSERSDRPVMAIDEFKVWKTAIEKVKRSINIDDLEKSKFIDKLCDEISTSDVSHFIFEQFVRWMWSSLFQRFDENKYEEFVKLGVDGSRQDFSLDRYIIVRLLLCNYSCRSLYTFTFKKDNQAKMKSELCGIKDILDYEH